MTNIPDVPSTGERTKILLCLTLCCLIAFTGESRAQFEVQVRAPGNYAQLDHDQFWRKITIVCEPKAPPGGAKPAAVPVTLEKDWIARVALKLADVQKISWQLNEGNEWILYPPYDTAENRPNPVKTFYVTSYDKIRVDTIKALRSQIKASGKFKEADDELAKVEEVYRLAPTENVAEGVEIPMLLAGGVSVPDQLNQMLKDLIEAAESYRVHRDERVGAKTAARDYEESWRLKLISSTEVETVFAAKALDAAANEAEKTSRRVRLDVALRRLLVAVHDWDSFAVKSYLRPPKKRVAEQKKADGEENPSVVGNPRQPVKDKVGLDGAYYNEGCKTGFRGDIVTVLWALQKSEVKNAIENKFQAIAERSDASAAKAKNTMILWNRIIDTDLDDGAALDELALPDIEDLLDGLFEPYRGH